MSDSRTLSVKPIIHYPRVAQVGKTYLMTIDLEVEEGFEWQYDEEEYPIYCEVDSELFSSKPVGEPVIVLHRFGGSYGEVKFLLTSAIKPEGGKIRVILINRHGVPFKVLNLEDILLKEDVAQQPEVIQELELAERIYTHGVFSEKWATPKNDLKATNGVWLQQFSRQITTELVEESNAESVQGALLFLVEILQRIVDSQGEVNRIYPFLVEHQQGVNDFLLQAISIAESQLFNESTEQSSFMALVFVTFGNLIAQFPLGRRSLNLELAINAYQLALNVITCESSPENWAIIQNNLAIAYRNRIFGDRADNLEQAMTAYQLALQVRTHDAFLVDWAMTQNNLATAYRERIRGERADNLEQAIATYELALQVYARDTFPVDWAMTLNNLATAYRERIRGERVDNLEQAIATYELVFQVRTYDAFPEQWAETQNNLALAYSKRIRGERADNLEQAIAAYEQALTVRTQAAMPVEWATTMMNLATAYKDRIRGDRADNIEQAIAAYEQALTVRTQAAMPVEWATTMMNLATAYSNRIRGDRADNIEQAIAAYQDSLEIFEPERSPDNCRKTARSLGNLYSDQQRWAEALTSYKKALQAAELLYQSANLLDGKAAELAETADLPQRAAYALARHGDFSKAVETLEQGRARGLSESLDRDRANLDQLQQFNADLYHQYRTLTEQLRNLENQQRDRTTSSDRHSLTPEALRDSAIALRQQFDKLIQAIRQEPGYKEFLALPTFEDVRRAVQCKRPLVYLVPTPAGSLVLIVTSEDTQSIWLDDLTEELLRESLQIWFAAYEQSQQDPQSWLDSIDSVTRQLWEPLMQPLIHHLETYNFCQATLIPTGLLSFLPLHAAWVEDTTRPTGRHYALDDIHFTYAPNAKSLTAAQAIAQQVGTDSILAIDNPCNDLPNSEREVNAAIAHFPQSTVLRHAAATVEGVRSQLSEAEIVHFSCHGTANLTDPLNSGLLMSDGLLTLKDIFALNLADSGGIRLAVLSASETGLSGIQLPDEVMSLPAGLMQAGVAGVIASLWAVSDLSAMLLLTQFYDLWHKHNLPPDQALRQAQLWLRDTTESEIASRLGHRTRTPNHRPFAHPFYWADFCYTGV